METELRQINELLAIAEYEMRQLRGLSETLMDQVNEAKKGLDLDQAEGVVVGRPSKGKQRREASS
jgi:hypothetical protein